MQHIFSQQRQCSPSMFVDAIRLFPPSYRAFAVCCKHDRFDHEGFSMCFPSAICFVSRSDRFSTALLLWVSQAVFPVLSTQRVPSIPESGSKHDWRLYHDRLSRGVHREAHLLAAFSVSYPGAIRCNSAFFCYAYCVPMRRVVCSRSSDSSPYAYRPCTRKMLGMASSSCY